MRTPGQECWDKFVLLRLLREVSKKASAAGNTKAQKLVFLAELQGQEAGIALSHFKFFRYQYGPYSAFLANDITALEDVGVITKSSRRLTKRGHFLHDYVLGALSDDGRAGPTTAAVDIVGRVAKKYGVWAGKSLMEHVYGLTVPVIDFGGQRLRVVDIPVFVDILDPVHTADLQDVQPLPSDLIDDIQSELAIPEERLRPEHPSMKRTVRAALSAIPA